MTTLTTWRPKRSDFVVVPYNVSSDPAARDRLRELSEAAGILTPGVPRFVLGGEALVGFDSGVTPTRLRAILDRAWDMTELTPLGRLVAFRRPQLVQCSVGAAG